MGKPITLKGTGFKKYENQINKHIFKPNEFHFESLTVATMTWLTVTKIR